MNPRFKRLGSTVMIMAAGALAACGDDTTSENVDMAKIPDLAVVVDMVTPPDLTGNTDDLAMKPCPVAPDNVLGGNAGNPDGGLGESATIDKDLTLQAGCTYTIARSKFVFVTSGHTLTIEPGVTIKGGQGSVLAIARGAKINAVGTKDKVIVLTSDQADGAKTPGYWGGLLVLGKAPINTAKLSMPPADEVVYEAFVQATELGKFGGNDPADNSGTIKYLRVEFGGFNFIADREFNNLTLCGVGSGTTIDYVQVHGGSDDGIELFGGTVNVKHVISSQNGDDGFDTDNGWQGKGQFVIVQNVQPQGAVEASNGYESDNHGTAASYEAAPRTLPTMYNVTVIGKKDYMGGTSWAGVLRRGTGGKYFNHIFMNFQKGIEFRDLATKKQLDAGDLFFKNSIFFGNDVNGGNYPPPQAMNDIVEKDYFEKADWSNRMGIDPGLETAASDLAAPNFKPKAMSEALKGAATPPNDGFFDATATFVGAIGADDWTAGWAKYTAFKL